MDWFGSLTDFKYINVGSVSDEITQILLPAEKITSAFGVKTEQIVFTNSRIIYRGRISFNRENRTLISLPYLDIRFFSVQIDAKQLLSNELFLMTSSGVEARFFFSREVDIYRIVRMISELCPKIVGRQ